MSTSIGDPFLLSTYSIPHRLGSYTGGTSPSLANVYATHQNGLSPEGHVVAAAQGDGVHILDLSSLHPVVSHTLGPSTVFSCPAVSRAVTTSEGVKSAVYAVMENVQAINPDERGRTVRAWIDNASGEGSSSSVQQKMYSVVLPHRVSRIVISDELPDNILFIGAHGEVTITDNEVNVQYTHPPLDSNARLIRSYAFGRRACSLVPGRSPFKQGIVVVMLVKVGEDIRLVVLGAEPSKIIVIGDCPVPVAKFDVLDASCSDSGFMTLLSRSGDWYALQIDSPDYTTITLVKSASPICLKGLTCLANTAVSTSLDEVSVASLGSSHVLLVGVTSSSSPELVLLLWDLQYGVLLTSKSLPIPSSVHRNKKNGIDIQLAVASGRTQQALLVLSAKSSAGMVNGSASGHEDRSSNDTAARSTVLMVPYTVPAASTVANALGRAALGERWLTTKSAAVKPAATTMDSEQAKCIRVMRTGMEQKKIEAVDDAFFAWAAHAESSKTTLSSRSTAPKISYSYEFVKQTLDVVLRAPKGSSTDIPYSSKIVRHLLEKRCVSSNMVPGGLLPALRLRQDWVSMVLAVKTVQDIPEDHLVSLLSAAVTTPRQREKQPLTDDPVMNVDTSAESSAPPLSSVLPLCVTYPTTAPALRLALRSHLSDAKALTLVLERLADWLNSYAEEEPQLLPEGTKKDLHGALVPVYEEKKKKKHRLPPLEKVLFFIQTILDSSFLFLLSYPPSFDILRRIFSYIEPETSFSDDLEQLRGPLEPFVKTHTKMVYEAAHGPEKPDPNVDWRKTRKEAHERAAIAVGVYQLEELVL